MIRNEDLKDYTTSTRSVRIFFSASAMRVHTGNRIDKITRIWKYNFWNLRHNICSKSPKVILTQCQHSRQTAVIILSLCTIICPWNSIETGEIIPWHHKMIILKLLKARSNFLQDFEMGEIFVSLKGGPRPTFEQRLQLKFGVWNPRNIFCTLMCWTFVRFKVFISKFNILKLTNWKVGTNFAVEFGPHFEVGNGKRSDLAHTSPLRCYTCQ